MRDGFCALRARGDTRNREDSRLFIQGETLRWHCAARREIAERSEEAPEAAAAQPSRNGGNGKPQRGASGDARGAEKGAQPHNRPRLAARRAGGPNNKQRKTPVPAGRQKSRRNGQALPLSISAYRAIPRRAGASSPAQAYPRRQAHPHHPVSVDFAVADAVTSIKWRKPGFFLFLQSFAS